MQLPPSLRAAIDRELNGIALADLARASEALSQRYRAEVQDGRLHLADDAAARAYLTTRLPATFAAISAALGGRCGGKARFRTPQRARRRRRSRHGNLGRGPAVGQPRGRDTGGSEPRHPRGWRTPGAAAPTRRLACLPGWMPRSSISRQAIWSCLAYVLDELPEAARRPLIKQLWALTADTLLIVEPGTPAGWKRILRARDILIQAGAHILAPCPHARPCPLAAPDWCHFSARVARSRLHREAKGGTVPWEDEKFIYVAASRQPGFRAEARVIAPPRASKAAVTLKLCQEDGYAADRVFAKRAGDSFKIARRLDWGDIVRK